MTTQRNRCKIAATNNDMTQTDLTPDPHPATVTVNGAGLLAYSERAKAGECHIYRMLWKDNAKYVLSLTWLEGR